MNAHIAFGYRPRWTRVIPNGIDTNMFRPSETVRKEVRAELGIDSLELLEVIGSLERDLDVRVPDDQLVGIQTVGQLLNLVALKLPQS